MNLFKEELIKILDQVKGNGKFASIRSANFVIPGLKVDGLGEISFPLNEIQAKYLINLAHKAPFGKGTDTVLDNSVRSAWEIDAENFTTDNPAWKKLMTKIIRNVKLDLGLADYFVEAHSYKLLVYEEGDFFLKHKDTEKEKGMFGTLIVGLPSQHSGGELLIEFDGVTEVARFDQDYNINYAAFYADCDHEIKPLLSGYRICLVYNLVQQQVENVVSAADIHGQAGSIAKLFAKHENENQSEPYFILLGHQYTPENFSLHSLKLNDRSKAEALLLAAEKAGYYAKMCLITSYLSGSPVADGYHYRDRYSYDEKTDEDSDAEMEEVYDEDLSIEHWLENEIPNLDDVSFEESDLITSFKINDGDPILKESTGYMGNYGPDLMHWYHYGAVMIWSPKVNAELLTSQNVKNQMDWISYFMKSSTITEREIDAVNCIIQQGNDNNVRSVGEVDYNGVFDWIIQQNQRVLLFSFNTEKIQFYFCQIDVLHWYKLFNWLSMSECEILLGKVTDEISFPVLDKLPIFLLKMGELNFRADFMRLHLDKLPEYFNSTYLKTNKRIDANCVSMLLELERKQMVDSNWITSMINSLSQNPQWENIHNVLVPQLLKEQKDSRLKDKLMFFCKSYLQERIDNKPQVPENWIRPFPDSTAYKFEWLILKDFLASPTKEILTIAKIKQNEINFNLRSKM